MNDLYGELHRRLSDALAMLVAGGHDLVEWTGLHRLSAPVLFLLEAGLIGLVLVWITRTRPRDFRAIKGDAASHHGNNMEGSSLETALQCLVAIARHHGIDLSADRIKHDYALKPNDDITRLLPKIARSSGMRSRKLQVGWKDLQRLGEAYPAIARDRKSTRLNSSHLGISYA